MRAKHAFAIGTNFWKAGEVDAARREFIEAIDEAIKMPIDWPRVRAHDVQGRLNPKRGSLNSFGCLDARRRQESDRPHGAASARHQRAHSAWSASGQDLAEESRVPGEAGALLEMAENYDRAAARFDRGQDRRLLFDVGGKGVRLQQGLTDTSSARKSIVSNT
jgi:hypothetical protein